jgi:hypothetical protein
MKRTFIATTAFILVIAACSPSELIAEQILEGQEGVDNVEIDSDTGEIKIEVEGEDGGSISIGGGDVPSGFPIDIPGGGEVQAVLQAEGNTTVSLIFDSADFETISAFYESWVDGSGADVQNKFETSNPPSVAWTLEKGSDTYTISISEAGPQTIVSLFVTES